MERRSGENRPTLRNRVGQYEGHEGGEHPESEKYQEDSETIMPACPKRQADRAHRSSRHRHEGRCTQDAKDPTLGRFQVHFRVHLTASLDTSHYRRGFPNQVGGGKIRAGSSNCEQWQPPASIRESTSPPNGPLRYTSTR